jgi:hypothetical protein
MYFYKHLNHSGSGNGFHKCLTDHQAVTERAARVSMGQRGVPVVGASVPSRIGWMAVGGHGGRSAC